MYESSCSYQSALDLKRASPIAQVNIYRNSSWDYFLFASSTRPIFIQRCTIRFGLGHVSCLTGRMKIKHKVLHLYVTYKLIYYILTFCDRIRFSIEDQEIKLQYKIILIEAQNMASLTRKSPFYGTVPKKWSSHFRKTPPFEGIPMVICSVGGICPRNC